MVISGSLAIDESSGVQNSGNSADSTGNDVAIASLASAVPEFDAILTQVVGAGVTPTGVAVSNGSPSNPTGTAMVTSLGANVSDLAFTDSAGNPLSGAAAKFGAGANDFLRTADGYKIYLYSFTGDVPNVDDENNAVFGRKANADGTPNPAGDIVFAAYLQATNSSGAAQTSDTDAAGAKVWLVEYQPIQHGTAGSTAAAYDDARFLTDPLYITVSNRIQFSLEGAPSGQNLFLTFGNAGDGIANNGIGDENVAIVVTGQSPADQSSGASITTGQTVNTGQGGGGTTLGNTNQMIDPNEGLYFTFVKDTDPNLTVNVDHNGPYLDQNEADIEANIKFNGLFATTAATFSVVQLQPPKATTLKLSVFTTAPEPGVDFVNGLSNDGAPGDIDYIKVTSFNKNGTVAGTFEFIDDDTSAVQVQDGITVDFLADGTVTIKGIESGDKIEYHSAGVHNRVLIQNVGTDTNFNSPFDIGGFSLLSANRTSSLFSDLSFQDDGPSVSTTGTRPTLTVDETDLLTNATGNFAPNFSVNYGADGAATSNSITYALGVSAAGVDSLLVDTASGNHVFLRVESGQVVGREGTNATDAITGDIVFTVSVSAAGVVTLDQQRAVVHDDPADPDESTSPATIAASLITLTATATDKDGDTASTPLNIGDTLKFEDDGPSVGTTGTRPTLTVDETDLLTNATGNFAPNFTPTYGADGAASSNSITYALGVSAAGVDSLLVDTASGNHVFLRVESGQVVGREGTNATDAIGGDIVFTVAVSASGVVTLDQQRAVVHDDPADPDESTSPATIAASLITLTATATDKDGDTASTPLNIGDTLKFEDDGPSVSFGNVIGTGTVLAQTGYWTRATGNDGLGAAGLNISLTGFTLVRPDGTPTTGSSSFSELSPGSPDANGNYLFTGSLTGDFDNNATTSNTTVDFALTAYADNHWTIDLVQGFASTVTTSTANGALGAGGPDPVQTLTIAGPPSETVVFFSAKNSASDADLLTGIGQGLTDPTEGDLQTTPLPGYIDPQAMNVSTSGIGVANNLLEGDTAAAIGGVDESFVVNPGHLLTSVTVKIDNSVGGYEYTSGELLYYKAFYNDGSNSGNVLVQSNLGLANKGQATSFVINTVAGKTIDAVQLTMAKGAIKIPEILFTTSTDNLANDVKLDFLATFYDKDGDSATDAFSADLYANKVNNPTFDYVLTGLTGEQDSFNVDLAGTKNKYQVNGFELGSDKLLFIGNASAGTPQIDNSGANSVVSILESGGQTTTVTVVGVHLTLADMAVLA